MTLPSTSDTDSLSGLVPLVAAPILPFSGAGVSLLIAEDLVRAFELFGVAAVAAVSAVTLSAFVSWLRRGASWRSKRAGERILIMPRIGCVEETTMTKLESSTDVVRVSDGGDSG